MRLLLPVALAAALTLSLPASAHAILYGIESNGELINSNRDPSQQAATLDLMRSQGAGLVRVNAGWNEVATPACASRTPAQLRNHLDPCYSWHVIDGFVQQANERNLQPLMSVSRAPQWLHRSADPFYLGATGTQWSRSVAHYEAFMYAMAKRYVPASAHGTIRLYTVWNEPNSATFFKPMNTVALRRAAPSRYAQLLVRTARAIKLANPSAAIAAGPTGPQSTLKPQTYIRSVQARLPVFLGRGRTARQGGISAWAHNPYPGLRSPSQDHTRAPRIGMGNIGDLFRELDRSPVTRGLPVWATEFGWQTNPPDRAVGIAPALQGRYMAEAYDWLDSTRRVTVAVWYGLTDPVELDDFQSGTLTSSGARKPSWYWAQRPVSVSASSVRRGQSVRVWARSMVKPAATRIAVSTNGRSWRLLPGRTGRRTDGTTVRSMTLYRTTWFATWDGTRGPARAVAVRR